MDNEKRLWKELWDKCITSKNPRCTRIRDRSAQLQSLGWRYPVCPTDSRIDIMFVGINPRKNINVKIEYNDDFEEYYEESKEKSFMNDSHFKNFHKPLLRKIKEEGYHPTSFFTEIILCPTDGVNGLGKRDEDINKIANTCTSNYLKELIKIEMPKVIVAEGNLPVRAIREQFGLTDEEVQVTKSVGKKEKVSVDHNNLWLIWSPHPNAWIPKKVISKKKVIEKICGEIVSILKVS